jgi:predicted DsbA family dithiol-disulfide isomerase
VDIDIYSDVTCPWCYLGVLRLRTALTGYPGEAVLRWRPFQLDPSAVGEPVLSRLARKFGGDEAARRAAERATAAGAADGVELRYDRAVSANTFDAHRLLWFADQPSTVLFGATASTQPDLAMALYAAHFTDGMDVSSPEVLVDLAVRVGLDGDRARRLLDSDEGRAEVVALLAEADALGITAVPTFVFAGMYAVTGAHDPQTLRLVLSRLDEAAQAVDDDRTG